MDNFIKQEIDRVKTQVELAIKIGPETCKKTGEFRRQVQCYEKKKKLKTYINNELMLKKKAENQNE